MSGFHFYFKDFPYHDFNFCLEILWLCEQKLKAIRLRIRMPVLSILIRSHKQYLTTISGGMTQVSFSFTGGNNWYSSKLRPACRKKIQIQLAKNPASHFGQTPAVALANLLQESLNALFLFWNFCPVAAWSTSSATAIKTAAERELDAPCPKHAHGVTQPVAYMQQKDSLVVTRHLNLRRS